MRNLSETFSLSVMAVSLFFAFMPSAQAKYNGGTGEPNDPYRIATPQDLNDIGNHKEDWDKHFILVNDVNLAEYTGTQFNIIGKYFGLNDPNNKPFIGVFDGNDHKIWNFTWSSDHIDSVGLFGYVGTGGQIKNLGMENVDVNAVNGYEVGGLVGCNQGTITICYSSGSVTGGWCVGGLVGTNGEEWVRYQTGHVYNCYSIGNILGQRSVGGLVGVNLVTIYNCYSTGRVSGNAGVGGLVGKNFGRFDWFSFDGLIYNCYSTGSVLGNSDVGGLVGEQSRSEPVSSFWDIETSGQLTSAGGTPKTTAEMKTIDTFTDAGWDFVEIWGIGENQTYPFLRTEPAGDSNYDGKVDLVDLAILASHWLEGN